MAVSKGRRNTGDWPGGKPRLTYHEVTLDELELAVKLLLLSIVCSAVDLVVVVVQTDDVATGELGDLAGRSTNTAADIENSHALLDTNLVRQVVLMAGNGLVERLVVRKATEVEGLAPAVLVDVRCKVVVVPRQGGVLLLPGLFCNC